MDKQVLVVKREAEEIAHLMKSIPVELYFASNPNEAVAVMKALTEPFDLILVGAVFEDSRCLGNAFVQGPDFVRNIRKSGIATKILMFSVFEEENKIGIAAGANGSLKPNYDEEMKQKLLEELVGA